jgi:oxygen-independent coproporphyrinogen-3 oxidase
MARDYFHHYEVSNLARPGFEAVHNSAYWRRIPYLGLGPGAHSAYAQHPEEEGTVNVRTWNSCDPVNWKEAGRETLTPEQRQEETLMLGLRTSRGLPENWMRAHCDTRALERLLAAGALEKGPEGTIRIAEHHFFVSDEIIAEL